MEMRHRESVALRLLFLLPHRIASTTCCSQVSSAFCVETSYEASFFFLGGLDSLALLNISGKQQALPSSWRKEWGRGILYRWILEKRNIEERRKDIIISRRFIISPTRGGGRAKKVCSTQWGWKKGATWGWKLPKSLFITTYGIP